MEPKNDILREKNGGNISGDRNKGIKLTQREKKSAISESLGAHLQA